jgi:hypothetical protein
MERELWWRLYRTLRATARDLDQKYVHHHPWVITAVLLWAALHDRPVAWACQARHWHGRLRPDPLPDPSTVSRRARRSGSLVFANRLSERLRGAGPPAYFLIVDGKPLTVGTHSKDRDARSGRVSGGFARGYKLHALWGERALPEAWSVTGLNEYEGTQAEQLLRQVRGCGYLLADGNYEASRVYDAAAEAGYQLVARPDGRDTGGGHRYQSPHRLRALEMFADGFGWQLLTGRGAIERRFGNLTSFGGGLSGLPAWVRRLGRVTRWVWAKLVINAARILNREQPLQRLQ